jgi:hypothetical protein
LIKSLLLVTRGIGGESAVVVLGLVLRSSLWKTQSVVFKRVLTVKDM